MFYFREYNYEKSEKYFNLFIDRTSDTILNDPLKTKLNYARLKLGIIKMYNNNFTDAIENYKKILDTSLSFTALKNLIIIEIKEENYKEAYSYFLKLINKKNIELDNHLRNTEHYLKYKLGLQSKEDNNDNNYFYHQLTNYDCNNAICHIKKNHSSNSKSYKSTWDKDISISNTFDEVKSIIYNENSIFYKPTSDQYLIEFNYIIGNINGKDTNIACVVTLPNTKAILTMYPSYNNIPISLKAYNKEEEVKTKEFKRESQIDKFNRKYGMK